MKDGVHNAKILDADFRWDGHHYIGVKFDYGGAEQGIKVPGDTFTVLSSLLDVAGTTSLHAVIGRYVRVELVDGLPVRIGHILNDSWFSLKG